MAAQTLQYNTIQPATTVRWGSGWLLALALHAGLIVWISYHALDSSIEAPPPAMMLMVADSVQSTPSPQDAPVGPQQTLSTPQEAATQPEKMTQDVPLLAPAPKPVMAAAQKEKPQPQKKVQKKNGKTGAGDHATGRDCAIGKNRPHPSPARRCRAAASKSLRRITAMPRRCAKGWLIGTANCWHT
nr:hypothetical protein [Pectobacterium brasiliense]